jgi:uncharacterized protein YbjT (DUF2867 family)
MSASRRKVFVSGATGAQGGAVARSLLNRGFEARCLTRCPRGPAALALQRLGAEIVAGDLADLSTLIAAMRGCQAAFGVTNYWEHFGAEVTHGYNIVDAARACAVPHLVLSTLPSSKLMSHGKLLVPHIETKFEIERYALSSGQPSTFVHVAFYFENFLSYFRPKLAADGGYEFGFPQGDTPLAALAINDLGPFVSELVAHPQRFLGQTVGAATLELRGDQYAASMSRVLACDVRYRHISSSEYANLGFPGAEDLASMFDLNRRFTPTRVADIALMRELHPARLDFDHWLELTHPRFDTLLNP